MSEIKNGGLDQYGAEPFKQQQFGPAGVKGFNKEKLPTMTSVMDNDECTENYEVC